MQLNRYYFIDRSKVVMAVMIVMLHSLPLFNNPTVSYYFSRILDTVVPVFFCFSGFFFARHTDLKKSLRHLATLYLFYAVVSWPLSFIVFKGLTIWQALHKVIFFGTFNIGWYIIALMWCMIIFAAIDRVKQAAVRYTVMAALALLSYAVCVCFLNSYPMPPFIVKTAVVYRDLFMIPTWSFPRGILFFCIGFFFFRFNLKFTAAQSMPLLIVALGLYFAELAVGYRSGHEINSISFSLPLVVFAFMAFALSQCRPEADNGRGKLMRQISTMLYLSHPMIMFLLYRATGINSGLPRFAATLAVFAVIFVAYHYLCNRRYFHWLRYAS